MTLTAAPSTTDAPPTPRWLHGLALLTVLATLPLLTLGAEVTTKGVGMVDPDAWSHFREPWIFLRQWQDGSLLERGLAYVIEHGHRLAGIAVGLCAIGLAAGLWFCQRRRWLAWLGLAALLAVIVQGMLGAFRVHLHALMGPNLALIHGLTAQLVFALLVSLAVLTSPRWFRPVSRFDAATSKLLRRLVVLALGIVYGQLILGAFIRHAHSPLASRLHLLAAFLVVAAIVWLLKEWFTACSRIAPSPPTPLPPRRGRGEKMAPLSPALGGEGLGVRGEKFAGLTLAGFLLLQLFLGVEAWLSKFQVVDRLTREPLLPLGLHPDLLRSLHFLGGALVFASLTVVTLLIFRRGRSPLREKNVAPDYNRQLEGVA